MRNAFLTGPIAVIAAIGWLLVCLVHLGGRRISVSLTLFRSNLGVAFRAYLIAIFGFLVLRVDLLMVQYLRGSVDAGCYSIAAAMADAVVVLPAAIASILFPKLSGIRNETERWQFARRAAIGTGLTMVPLVVLCTILAGPVVRLFFGVAFMAAAPAFIYLMPGIVFLGVETVIVQFLNSTGFPKELVVAWVICCCANVGLNLWIIPVHGIVGASLVSSSCYMFICIVVIVLCVKSKNKDPRKANPVDEVLAISQ